MKIGIKSKNIFTHIPRYPTGKHEINFDLLPEKNKYYVYFMLLPFLGKAVSKSSTVLFRYSPWHTASQYYVKLEKCKVNDVIFPSGCEARAYNLGNKNMKIGIFTGGGTSVRSENIFTDISRYPTGKHEIKLDLYTIFFLVIFQTMDIFSAFFKLFSDHSSSGYFKQYIHSVKS